MKDTVKKMKNRQVPMTNDQWEKKAEHIRRFYNLASKSEATRLAIDKLYEKTLKVNGG